MPKEKDIRKPPEIAPPSWTRGDKTLPGGSEMRHDKVPPFGRPQRSGDTAKEEDPPGDSAGESSKRVCLGRTQGLMAVGAWAAREEIASFLESGCKPSEILEAIRSGEELGPLLSGGVSSKRDPPIEMENRPSGHATLTPPGSARSGSRSSLPSSLEAPSWAASSPNFSLEFRKQALAPGVRGEKSGEDYRPSSPEDELEEVDDESVISSLKQEDMTPFKTPHKEEITSLVSGFRKRAGKPKGMPAPQDVRSTKARYVPKALPRRANPSEQKKLEDYDARTLAIFEGLDIAGVDMELLILAYSDQGFNMEKFRLYTEPRSGGTGLRYARMMERLLEFYWGKYGKEAKYPSPVGKDVVLDFIETTMSKGAGYRTPKAMLYALDFYAVVFGFDNHGSKWPRCVRMADDYSKKAPPRNPAPFLDVGMLRYLEKVILDTKKPLVYRITSGKLRLCAQASIRHDDLNNTPLHNTEWCRLRGSRAVVGLRAKASKTKTGPRPWVATHFHRDHDEWLPCLVKLILDCHGDMWKTRSFFAPGFVGDQSPSNFPSSLENDALIIKRMLKEDLEKGIQTPLNSSEVERFRWHGSKSSMPTFMGHLGIKAKVIRFQGAWSKKEDSMVDTYLREAQVIVLRGQVAVMEKLRSGEEVGSLEGFPLGEVPTRVPEEGEGVVSQKDHSGEASQKESSGVPTAEAMAEEQSIYLKNSEEAIGGFDPKMMPDMVLFPKELRDNEIQEVSVEAMPLALAEEALEKELDLQDCLEDMGKEKDEVLEEKTASGGSEDSEASLDGHDMDMLEFLVSGTTRVSKVHRPSLASEASPLDGVFPKCGSHGKNYTMTSVAEALPGGLNLCARCFGKSTHCNGLCSKMVKRRGVLVRCARRCSLQCQGIPRDEVDARNHACSFHIMERMDGDT